jgi:hypothetical protein
MRAQPRSDGTAVKLGLQLGYWGATRPTDGAELVGDEGCVRRQFDRWAASGVTMILIQGKNAQHISDPAHLATACRPQLEKAGRQ